MSQLATLNLSVPVQLLELHAMLEAKVAGRLKSLSFMELIKVLDLWSISAILLESRFFLCPRGSVSDVTQLYSW